MKTIFKLTLCLFSVLFIATAVSQAFPEVTVVEFAEGALVVAAVVGVARFFSMLANPDSVKRKVEGYAFAVTIEVWEDFIAGNLFKMYEWLLRAKDRSSRVLGGSVVHIPQAGTVVSSQRNRAVYPVPLVKRSDSDITYVIDEISSDATHIKDAETVELSYDKITDVIGDHTNKLGQDCAKNALYRWFNGIVTGNIVRTTGATATSYLSGSTGDRKKPLVADIESGKTIMNTQTKKESGKRIALMTEDFYNQLKSDAAIDTMEKHLNKGAVYKDGDLVRISGFDIIRTDVIPRFTNATPPVAKDPLDPTVVNAASDNDACLLIDLDFVHIAKGDIKFFETIGDALLQGDAYSALVRIGAARERNDQAGVVAIVQVP